MRGWTVSSEAGNVDQIWADGEITVTLPHSANTEIPGVASRLDLRRSTCKVTVMQNGHRFRLTRYAMAIAQRDGRNSAILVPEGAIIEVLGGPFDGTRLMDVIYDGEAVMMFTDDMKTHTEAVRAETA
jgi:hypothetical protein